MVLPENTSNKSHVKNNKVSVKGYSYSDYLNSISSNSHKLKNTLLTIIGTILVTGAFIGGGKFYIDKKFQDIYNNSYTYDINRDLNNDSMNDKVRRVGDNLTILYSHKINNNFMWLPANMYKELNPNAQVDFAKHAKEYTIQPVKEHKRRRH